MMRVDELTFAEAMEEGQRLRDSGYVGISIFHQHQLRKVEADEGCYSVYADTPEELAEKIREDEEPEPPMPPFEIMSWSMDEDGTWTGQLVCEADTLSELLEKGAEQNESGT